MDDERFMRMALRLAGKGVGSTSPNPAVGAVVVRNGRVIGRGWHSRAGAPHAEVEAFRSCKTGLKGARLYVTLEPCCTFGRTPPCTDAIISSGITGVVVGSRDPNPKVSGRGVMALKRAGIKVIEGVLEEECRAINRPFEKLITTGLPFVTLKCASTLDGRIATQKGESRWITSEESRRIVHRLRSENDAVLVGGATALKDDPRLTVRLVRGRNPLRVLIDTGFRVSLSSMLFKGLKEPGNGGLIVFTTREAGKAKIKRAKDLGAEVVVTGAVKEGVDLKRVLKALGERGVASLLVEGGAALSASFLKSGLIDRLVIFLAPKLIGSDGVPSIGQLGIKGLKDAVSVKEMRFRKSGADIMIEGILN